MSHRRVGWELQHHYHILLHLLRKHQRGLQEKILFRPPQDGQRNAGKRGEKSQGAADEEQNKKTSGDAVVGVSEDKTEGEGGKRTERKLEVLSRTAEQLSSTSKIKSSV